MKKTTKILAVVLTLIMLLSTAPLFASAAGFIPDAAKQQAIKECSVLNGGELTIDEIVRVDIGDTISLSQVNGSDYVIAFIVGDGYYAVSDNWNDEYFYSESLNADSYGVAVVTVVGYKSKKAVDKSGDTYVYDEPCGDYTMLVVVVDPDGMGKVDHIETPDLTFRYKETWDKDYEHVTWVSPKVYTVNDDLAYFTTVYSADPEAKPYVGTDGSVYTDTIGSTGCNVYVVDATGNIYNDFCTITVKYTFWQQLIRIFLLGFLWY